MASEDFDEEFIDKQENQTSVKTDTPLMYVGPNLPRMGLERYTVYRGELPPIIEDAINKVPEILDLLIPVDQLMSYTRNLLIPSSKERKLNKIVQEKINKILKE